MLKSEAEFELRLLSQDDKVKAISSGDELYQPLSNFLKKHAKPYHAQNLAKTYILFDIHKDRIAGYISLVCSEIVSRPDLLKGEEVQFAYNQYPAVKIARLLIDSRYRNEEYKGLGQKLVEFAIGIVVTEICHHVGCRFLVVDSKKSSVGFYEKCGFTLIDTIENRKSEAPVLYLDLYKATLS